MFSRYNWIMRITAAAVVIVAVALVYFQYRQTLAAEEQSLSKRVQSKASALNDLLRSSHTAVVNLQVSAETWFATRREDYAKSPLYHQVIDSANIGLIALGQPPAPWTKQDVGNLTGDVRKLTPRTKRELAMALSLNRTFKAIRATNDQAAWVYYTSASRFINIYPWSSTESFFYTDTLLTKPFFTLVLPSADPKQRVVWTPAYLDEAGKGLMVTVSAPVYDANDQFRGAVSLDLTLDRMSAFVRTWSAPFGKIFIVNNRNQLLAHPTPVTSNDSQVLSAAAAFPPAVRDSVDRILAASRHKLTTVNGLVIQTEPVTNAPFRLVMAAPKSALQLAALGHGLVLVLLLVGGLMIVVFTARYLANREAIDPAKKLVRYIQQEKDGTADELPDIPSVWRPWFESIREVFNSHARLVSIQHELDVARRMQQSILPSQFPHLPTMDIDAVTNPAQEVGGDFYDYFWLDEHRIGVIVADVSGKGIPASLFMAVSRTLIRATAPGAESPAQCLATANDLLSLDNEASMFVTVFYAILDLHTGELAYANGGHNPPVYVETDGAVNFVPQTTGVALGVMEDMAYADGRLTMTRNSMLVLYTDGVTEAFNSAGEQLSGDRLMSICSELGASSANALDIVVRRVDEFANGEPQSDDITCCVLHYKGFDEVSS